MLQITYDLYSKTLILHTHTRRCVCVCVHSWWWWVYCNYYGFIPCFRCLWRFDSIQTILAKQYLQYDIYVLYTYVGLQCVLVLFIIYFTSRHTECFDCLQYDYYFKYYFVDLLNLTYCPYKKKIVTEILINILHSYFLTLFLYIFYYY